MRGGIFASSLLLCAVSLPASARTQAETAAPAARSWSHEQELAAERGSLFLDAWICADEPARAAARRTLERLRHPAAAAAAPPTPLALTRAWRDLCDPTGVRAGEADSTLEALQLLADALDLRARPGCFAQRSEGLGEAMTVHVAPLGEQRPSSALELVLWWLPPFAETGLEPVRARGEPAGPDAFQAKGFDLYVRPPLGVAGTTWFLQLELVQGDRRARSVPVPVECVRDPAALLAAAADGPAVARAMADVLKSRVNAGLRSPPGIPLAALAGESEGLHWLPPIEGKQDKAPIWTWRPAGDLHGVLILLAPSQEPATAVLAGETGRLWRECASDLGALLVPVGLPRRGGPGDGAAEVLADLNARLEAFQSGAGVLPRVLVARGDSAVHLALGLGSGPPPFDGWVAVAAGASRPRVPWPETPCRVLSPEGPLEPALLDAASPRVTWQRGDSSVLLVEPRLPGVVNQAWPTLAQRAGPTKR